RLTEQLTAPAGGTGSTETAPEKSTTGTGAAEPQPDPAKIDSTAGTDALARARAEIRELQSILDTPTDGDVVLDRAGRIISSNHSAEALFGYEARELCGREFIELLAPESTRVASDYLDGLLRSGVASVLNDGREVIARVRQGGLIPVFMTVGRIGDDASKL